MLKIFLIKAKNITLDKNKQITIFKDSVNIKTEDNNSIKSDYAEYNKINKFIKLRGNIIATDNEK